MPVVGESPTTVAAVATPSPDVPVATAGPIPPRRRRAPRSSRPAVAVPGAHAHGAARPHAVAHPDADTDSHGVGHADHDASPKPTATPTSGRYALLKQCPDRKRCYVYKVRSGDNLFSIARYFGHSLATIYGWNPKYPETRLRVGDPIRMPPPTR